MTGRMESIGGCSPLCLLALGFRKKDGCFLFAYKQPLPGPTGIGIEGLA